VRPGARIQAAAEVLEDIFSRHQPAATALQDWGKRHRFAGSGDRAAIGTLVYDVLRRRLSLEAQMGSAAPRALALAAAPKALGLSPADVASACDSGPHAPTKSVPVSKPVFQPTPLPTSPLTFPIGYCPFSSARSETG
jgi:16S rRNA (cytosine967-C5)-methyltransferase